MISIPAVLLLALFGGLSLLFTVAILAHLYHGYRYGRNDPLTMGVNTAFLVAVVSVIILTVVLLVPVNWTQSFVVSIPSAGIPNPGQPIDLNTQP